MENCLNYIRIGVGQTEYYKIFVSLMLEYIEEMNEHSPRPLPEQYKMKWIDSIVAAQGPNDRYLELCYVNDEPIGFLYGKIDHEDHRGYIKPGYGYIMEFFVRPLYRRKGYGREMFARLEQLFRSDGAKMMYLTADPITGKPFWEAMGFLNTQEISPENHMFIYERDISNT